MQCDADKTYSYQRRIMQRRAAEERWRKPPSTLSREKTLEEVIADVVVVVVKSCHVHHCSPSCDHVTPCERQHNSSLRVSNHPHNPSSYFGPSAVSAPPVILLWSAPCNLIICNSLVTALFPPYSLHPLHHSGPNISAGLDDQPTVAFQQSLILLPPS